MEIKEIKFILSNTLPFNKLNETELDEFLTICEIKKYKHEELLYEEGDAPNYFYFLVKGRVIALRKENKEEQLELIKRGTAFGIISLFNDEPHSVTIKSIEDSTVIRVDKEKFKEFLKPRPLLSLEFYRLLSQRIRARAGHKKIFQCKRIAIFGEQLCGKTTYLFNLAQELSVQTKKKVICLELSETKKFSLSNFIGVQKNISLAEFNEEIIPEYIIKVNPKNEPQASFDCLLVNINNSSYFPSLLNYLSENYHFVIYEIPSRMPDNYELIMIADYFHFLNFKNRESLKKTGAVIKELKEKNSFNDAKIRIILNEFSRIESISFNEMKALLGHNIYATLSYSSDTDYPKTIKRISRQVGDVVVGLALGSGAAYGFAHIGVLKILTHNNIPIDIVCGSSIGAVIAALWACGYDAKEIEEITLEFSKKVKLFSFTGFSFPFRGFWKAKYLENILKNIFKEKTFYDLKHPLKIVVFDFTAKESRILEEGPLYKAVAASCAMPGIFEPIRFMNNMLLDGGILNPLPTKTLLNFGVNKIIAVNITPSQEEMLREYKKQNKMHILDFIFGSIETMQRQFIQEAINAADVVIHPNFQDLNWLDFSKAYEFIKRGEDATIQKINDLKEL